MIEIFKNKAKEKSQRKNLVIFALLQNENLNKAYLIQVNI